MLTTVQTAARRAAAAWRRTRALDAAAVGLGAGLAVFAAGALGIELTLGLASRHLPWLASALVVGPAAGLVALLRAPALHMAASEVDRRAALDDRLGTALEFGADASQMAVLQREDAALHAGLVRPGTLFRVPWRRRLGLLLPLGALALLVVAASLGLRLGPGQLWQAPQAGGAAEDLLASIDRERERMEERGDKEAVRLLADLERRVLAIRQREEDLRSAVARRRDAAPPPQQGESEESQPQVAPPPQAPRADLVTSEDLAQIEAAMQGRLAMTAAQERDLVAELFAHGMEARRLSEEFGRLSMREHEAAQEARASSGPTSSMPAGSSGPTDLMGGNAMADATSNESFASRGNPLEDIEQRVRRDIGPEAMAEHDRAHDLQESFNQFLREFVKDVSDLAQEAATGRRRAKDGDREVQVDSGQGVADKSSAMAESGFEEMGETKRSASDAPPERMMGMQGGTRPPEGSSAGTGDPGGMAMSGGPAQGGTSAGATGAGTGAPDDGSGPKALLDATVDPQGARGPLEEVLSLLAQGRLPPEERDALFDRIARHKVQAGLASEADDAIVDYFAQAEEQMIDNAGVLPALFRDYAHTYFDSIRPGAAGDGD